MIALNIPPGIHREGFAFEKWPDFDSELFSDIYNDDSEAKTFDHKIIGTDISGHAIAIAERNVKNAGLKNEISLEVKPFQQYTEAPQPAGVIMMNPPYGERIKINDIEALYNMIGERLKHVFTGYDAYVLSNKKENFDGVGLKPAKRFFLFNGPLEVEMRKYEIFAGRRDDRSRDEVSTRRYDRDSRPVGENKREFKQDFAPPRGDERHRSSSRDRDASQGRDRGGFRDRDAGQNRDRGGFRDRDARRGDDRRGGGFKERDRSFSRDDRPRGGDRADRPPHREHKPYDRKDIIFDDATNRPVFRKKDTDEPQPERKIFDLKKRKSEQSDEIRGAERRVNKVFIARKRPTKKNDSDTDVNKDTDKE